MNSAAVNMSFGELISFGCTPRRVLTYRVCVISALIDAASFSQQVHQFTLVTMSDGLG